MSGKRILYLDTETYSATDIRSSGSYKYMDDPAFEVLLLPFAWDDEPVVVLDLTDPEDWEELQDVLAGLKDPEVIKVAHNSAFERRAYHRAFMLEFVWVKSLMDLVKPKYFIRCKPPHFAFGEVKQGYADINEAGKIYYSCPPVKFFSSVPACFSAGSSPPFAPLLNAAIIEACTATKLPV